MGVGKLIDVKKNKIIQRLDLCPAISIFDSDWGLFGIVAGAENGYV